MIVSSSFRPYTHQFISQTWQWYGNSDYRVVVFDMSQTDQEGAAFKIDGVQLVDQAFFLDLFPIDEIFSLGNPVY